MKISLLTIGLLFSIFTFGTTFNVTNNLGTGAGSLHQAIIDANADVNEPHLISFANFTGPTEILLSNSGLPTIVRQMNIDASTHPLYNHQTKVPVIKVNAKYVVAIGLPASYLPSVDFLAIFEFQAGSSGSQLIGFEVFDEDEPISNTNDHKAIAVEVYKVNDITINNNIFHDLDRNFILVESRACKIISNKSYASISFVEAYLNCDNSVIRDNNITDIIQTPITIKGSFILVENNLFLSTSSPVGRYAIFIAGNVSTVHGVGSNNIIRNNIIRNYITGIIIRSHTGAISFWNLFGDNFTSFSNVSPTHNNIISGNLLTGISNKGIRLFYGTSGVGNDSKPMVYNLNLIGQGLITGYAEPGDIIELFGANSTQHAEVFLGTTTAMSNGLFTYQVPPNFAYNYVTITASDTENTSELNAIPIPSQIGCTINKNCNFAVDVSNGYCFDRDCDLCPNSLPGGPLYYTFTTTTENTVLNYIESHNTFGNSFNYTIFELPSGNACTPITSLTSVFSDTGVNGISELIPNPGTYLLVFNLPERYCVEACFTLTEVCKTCIGSFAPVPGQPYLVGAWVKQENAAIGTVSYSEPEIYINYTLSVGGPGQSGPFKAKGAIIDGWQRIEEKFDIPSNATDMEIELTCTSGSALFDDVRVFPFDASMKTFVYDPVNMRLAAELDERHYATFYEYDEEGKLVRIKKETEKGIMTIQETKSNASKSE